jgi:hypothetical protein
MVVWFTSTCALSTCLSPLNMGVWIPLMARCTRYTTLFDEVWQLFAAGRCISPDNPVSSTNKTDRHDIGLDTFKSLFLFYLYIYVYMSWVLWLYLLWISVKSGYIYNIGLLTVNIEFIWQGWETGWKTSF